jgi:hypothetical protein
MALSCASANTLSSKADANISDACWSRPFRRASAPPKKRGAVAMVLVWQAPGKSQYLDAEGRDLRWLHRRVSAMVGVALSLRIEGLPRR